MIPVFILIHILVGFAFTQEPTGYSPVIFTTTGPIRGRTAKTLEKGLHYNYFQGIPFAEPPVGDLRFKAPVKKQPWFDLRDAADDSIQCIQPSFPVKGKEDCLYLDIYSTTLDYGKLPVLVFIHGGGFGEGNSSYKYYPCDRFLDEQLVYVSVKYRLGIYGFGSTGDLTLPGNNGLKDQRMALEWIQENIGSFGGDPDKITIFGQSAGAASVHYQMLSPGSKGLFRSAIMNSGNSLCLWTLDKRARAKMFGVGKLLGISTNDSQILVDKLRKVKPKLLLTAAQSIALMEQFPNALEGYVFAPVMEPDHEGAFFCQKSYEQLSKGEYNVAPTLMGVASNEAAILQDLPFILRMYFLKFYYDATLMAPADLTNNTLKKILAGAMINFHYFGLVPPFTVISPILEFLSDDQFNRPTLKAARMQSAHAPTYLYKFSYEGKMGLHDRIQKGVGHCEDLKYLFGDYYNMYNYSTKDLTVSSRVVRMWANFVKYNNPTPVVSPLLQNVTWHKLNYNATETEYLDIGEDLKMKTGFFKENMDFFDRIYKMFGSSNYDTY